MKNLPNKSLQSIINHTTKDASLNSTPQRSIRQLLDKTNAASDGVNEDLVTSGLHNGSLDIGETNTTNNINESEDMPQNSAVPPSQSPEIHSHFENTQEPAHEANDITDAPNVSKKRGPGQTMGKCIMKVFVASGNKMKGLEVLGHGSDYIKGLGYGPKPPSRRTTSYDSSTRQLQNKLQETQEKLQEPESQVSGLKSQVGGFERPAQSARCLY